MLVPRDLVPADAASTKKEEFVCNRIEYYSAFEYVCNQKLPPEGTTRRKDLITKLDSTREIAMRAAGSATKKEFVRHFKTAYPNFKFDHGRKEVNDIKSFNRAFKKISDPKVRRQMGASATTKWLAANEYLEPVERQLYDMLGWLPADSSITCDPPKTKTRDDGTVIQKRSSDVTNMQHIMVNKKNSMINTIRNNIISHDKESYRLKYVDPKKANEGCGKVPRMVKIEPALEHIHGFNGWIGYHEGHPDIDLVVMDDVEPVENKTFHTWKRHVFKSCKTPQQILEKLNEAYLKDVQGYLVSIFAYGFC